jgi:hypothetical protein
MTTRKNPRTSRESSGEQSGDSKDNGNRLGMAEAVRRAVDEFSSLTRKDAEAVTGVRSEGDGWSVLVDVVELERIPSSTDVLATYRVDIDSSGQLQGYERLRRYNRGATDPS